MLAPVSRVSLILEGFAVSSWFSAPSFQTTNPQTQRTPELDFAQSTRLVRPLAGFVKGGGCKPIPLLRSTGEQRAPLCEAG